MKPITVLSLFDGISCGQVALNRIGIPIQAYYASEISKYAIKVTQKHFPSTIQLGDVTAIKPEDLPQIDLLIGGSPCQGFSRAGHGLNFDDPRSRLFFEYVRLLEQVKPKWFLFENVKMKKEWKQAITDCLGVEPMLINSALVSAQNRERLYWTNIPNVSQPEDKGIILRDIIEEGYTDRDKSYAIDANYSRGGNLKRYFDRNSRQLIFELPAYEIQGAAKRGQYVKGVVEKQLNVRSDYKSNAVVPSYASKLNGLIKVGIIPYIGGHEYNRRVYSPEGKSPTLAGNQGGHQQPKIAIDELSWRKLTPLECERLQTLPDNYTEGLSNTRRYETLGNGWTVDVIAHILKGIKECH